MEVVRLSHVIQAGPLVCLVCVMHVDMLHITPHGVRSVHLVMWRVGISAPVPCSHSQVRQAPTLSCHDAMPVVLCLFIRAVCQAESDLSLTYSM